MIEYYLLKVKELADVSKPELAWSCIRYIRAKIRHFATTAPLATLANTRTQREELLS